MSSGLSGKGNVGNQSELTEVFSVLFLRDARVLEEYLISEEEINLWCEYFSRSDKCKRLV